MKKILTLILSFVTLVTFAQEGPGQEKVKALYVAFISQELKLTESEAQRFWPVHAEYDDDLRGIRRDMPELDRQQQMLNIKKKYEDRFTKILGAERTNEFYRKDAEFRKRLVERLQKMRENRGRRPGGSRF